MTVREFVRLSDVCDTGSGRTPSRKRPEYFGGGVPWIKSGDLTDGLVEHTSESVTESAVQDNSMTLLPQQSLLIAMYGATVGKLGISAMPATTNQAVCHIVPDETSCSQRYLFHYLRAQRPAIISLGSGGAQPNISQKIIRELKIPLPPLAEQERIAGILDQAEQLRRLRRRALDRLNTLTQSIFHEMFGDPADNRHDFPICQIGDMLEDVRYGSSKKANTDGHGLPILRMGNITYEGRIDLTDLKHLELNDKELPKHTVQSGDLLFNRTNSKELVGKTAVFDQPETMAFAGYLIRARTNKDGNPHYISGYLNSAHGKATLRNMCNNIVGMANINAKKFQGVKILVPPIELQQVYAARIAGMRDVEAQFLKQNREADTLFASLQQRAFAGEL
ncbi:MAG: restriction endonuclease subunit S [Alphaproteobacteria bacterium]